MEPRITARRCKLDAAARTRIAEKVNKLGQYYDGITDIQVVVERDTAAVESYKAEVLISVFRQQLAGHAAEPTVDGAIDECVDHLRRQLLKYKSKLRRTS